jgi:hypothetical protein
LDSFHINFLNPNNAQFSKGQGGVLQLKIKGKIFYPRVWIYRSYPLSNKSELISVKDASHEDLPEIGVIYDIKQFPKAVQDLLVSELEKRHFMPVITEVITIKEARDHLNWEVITDKGKRNFTVRNPYENIRSIEGKRLLITDIHNCRYELQNYHSLKNKLKDILSKYIYL